MAYAKSLAPLKKANADQDQVDYISKLEAAKILDAHGELLYMPLKKYMT